jgi:hypothetical protein
MCPICLVNDPKDCVSEGIQLPCHHTVCIVGLTYWIKNNQKQICCVCRQQYKLEDCRRVKLI